MGNDKKPAPPPKPPAGKAPPGNKAGTAKPASKGSTTQRPPQR